MHDSLELPERLSEHLDFTQGQSYLIRLFAGDLNKSALDTLTFNGILASCSMNGTTFFPSVCGWCAACFDFDVIKPVFAAILPVPDHNTVQDIGLLQINLPPCTDAGCCLGARIHLENASGVAIDSARSSRTISFAALGGRLVH